MSIASSFCQTHAAPMMERCQKRMEFPHRWAVFWLNEPTVITMANNCNVLRINTNFISSAATHIVWKQYRGPRKGTHQYEHVQVLLYTAAQLTASRMVRIARDVVSISWSQHLRLSLPIACSENGAKMSFNACDTMSVAVTIRFVLDLWCTRCTVSQYFN